MAPRRKAVEVFTIVGEHKGHYIAVDHKELPVLLQMLSVYDSEAEAILGQSESRKGWVGVIGNGWGLETQVERCTFNPKDYPNDKGYPKRHYWQTLDGKAVSSRKAVFGLTKQDVLRQLAPRLASTIASERDDVARARKSLAKEEENLRRILRIAADCRRAGIEVKEPKAKGAKR